MSSVDIVSLVNSNPIDKFSKNYNSKIIEKIKEKFSDNEKQLFVANFYCYLKYNTKLDFVVRLDDIWDWIGYSRIDIVKNILVNNFIEDVDYQIEKIDTNKHKKENIKMTINCFKRLCLGSKTKKSSEIHEYYLTLEEIISELVCEQSQEFAREVADVKQKLQIKDEKLKETEKILKETKNKLEEKKEQLDDNMINNYQNTELVYFGYTENNIIKAGFTKDIKRRLSEHRNEISPDFSIIYVISTIYYIRLEDKMKQDSFLDKYRTKKVYNGKLQTELYKLDDKFKLKDFYDRVLYLISEIEKEDVLLKEINDLKEELSKANKKIEELENNEKTNSEKYDLETYSMQKLIDINNNIKRSICLNFLVNLIVKKIIENENKIDFEFRLDVDVIFELYCQYRISNKYTEPIHDKIYENTVITKVFNEIDGIVERCNNNGVRSKIFYVDMIVSWILKNIIVIKQYRNLFREISTKIKTDEHCEILEIKNIKEDLDKINFKTKVEEYNIASLKTSYSFLIYLLLKYKKDINIILIKQTIITQEYVKFMMKYDKKIRLTSGLLYESIFNKIPGVQYIRSLDNIRTLKFEVDKILIWINENLKITPKFKTQLKILNIS